MRGSRRTPARRLAGLFFCVLSLAIAILAVGCGGEEERFPTLDAAGPLQLGADQLGVGLYHGEALGLADERPAQMQESAPHFGHAFFRVKSYDEFSVAVGEYHAHPLSSHDPRLASDFSRHGTTMARLEARAADIIDELDQALDLADADGFSSRSFVVDFFRERGDWFVRWDGNLSDGPNTEGVGPYGFDRQDMVDDLLDHVEAVAANHEPAWIVLGDSMDRLVATDEDEEGISREQFDLFLDFFELAVERIHAASPGTRVAAGFHWENVTGAVARSLIGVNNAELTEEHLDEVFQEVILPFVEAGDGVALRSYTERAQMEEWKYQFLRRLDHLYGQQKPLIFYSVGSPIETQVSYAQQRLYLERFAEYMGGVNVQVLAWERLTNIQGGATGDQNPVGRCRALTSTTGRIHMERSACFDGLFELYPFEIKPAYQTLLSLVQ